MSNMYEINELLYRALEAQDGEIDTESGVVFNVDLIESLQMQREEIHEGLLLYADEKDLSAKGLRDRAKAMVERAVAMENKAESIRNHVVADMCEFGDKRLEGKYIRASMCESHSVVVDEGLLPREYFAEKIEYKPNKTVLKELLKGGKEIPGATLKTSKYLRIK